MSPSEMPRERAPWTPWIGRRTACLTTIAALAGGITASVTVARPTDAGGLAHAQLTNATLGEGLPLVGRSAGRKLVCGPNASARRYFLLVTRRSLREVRLKLERFVPSPPGTTRTWLEGETMVFDEDLASIRARALKAEKLAAERARARQAGLDRVKEWLRTPDRHDLPKLRQRANDHLTIFDGMPPEARRAVLQGRCRSVPFAAMSPEAREVISFRMRGVGASSEDRPDYRFDGRSASDVARIQVQAGPAGSPHRPGIQLILRLTPVAGTSAGDLTNSPGLHGPVRVIDVVKPPQPPPDDPDRKPPPELARRIGLTGGPGKTIERVLEELHEQTGLPIIGEYDPCFGNRYLTSLLSVRTASQQRTLERDFIRNVTIQRALDLIAWRFDLTWKFVDGWIELRSPWTPLADIGEVDLSPPEPADAP